MDDSLLISDLRNGKREVLDKIYRLYRQEFAFWLIKKYSCSMEEAMDIYQETIIIFYENVMKGKLDLLSSSIKTYLFSIGKYKHLEWHRKESRTVNQMDHHLEVIEDDNDPEGEGQREEILRRVEKNLTQLGEQCQKLLKLFYYDLLTMDQIVEKLSYKNSNTAKNQKYKCMERLRKIHLSQT